VDWTASGSEKYSYFMASDIFLKHRPRITSFSTDDKGPAGPSAPVSAGRARQLGPGLAANDTE
jgi:hypothetical protein